MPGNKKRVATWAGIITSAAALLVAVIVWRHVVTGEAIVAAAAALQLEEIVPLPESDGLLDDGGVRLGFEPLPESEDVAADKEFMFGLKEAGAVHGRLACRWPDGIPTCKTTLTRADVEIQRPGVPYRLGTQDHREVLVIAEDFSCCDGPRSVDIAVVSENLIVLCEDKQRDRFPYLNSEGIRERLGVNLNWKLDGTCDFGD